MEAELASNFIDQSLLMAVNYKHTGRRDKAREIMEQVKKIDADSPIVRCVWEFVAVIDSWWYPNLFTDHLGYWWSWQELHNKSIQIVCDQGMGDTILMLRYVKQLKEIYDCKIVLNCYAFHREFERLIKQQTYIDGFSAFHHKCDYYTNILSLPSIMNRHERGVHYPASFNTLLESSELIPPQPSLGEFTSKLYEDPGFKVGLAWHSNPDNPIGLKKSIPLNKFAALEDGVNQIFSLQPSAETANFLTIAGIYDLYDTASIIKDCDVVVSVDTAVLHLAGSMGKMTFGILPYEADARWGHQDDCVWYPSVKLFRQGPDMDWEKTISRVKQTLVEFRDIGYHPATSSEE